MINDLISVVTPCYNAAHYIAETIKTVISQTYENWEMLIIDDCSTDNSAEIINYYMSLDKRIRYYKTDKASGSPTVPRNIGVMNARGRFIAFLDSDDMWSPEKLLTQVSMFDENNVAIVFSDYEKISSDGKRMGRFILAPSSVNYKQLLNGNVIGNLTAIYDTSKTGKIYFEQVGHEDFVYWLSILKQGFIAKNTQCIHAFYRVHVNSISANKLEALKWTWNIYRNIEHLSLISSVWHFILYASKGFAKYLK